jgi:hypothetical protein
MRVERFLSPAETKAIARSGRIEKFRAILITRDPPGRQRLLLGGKGGHAVAASLKIRGTNLPLDRLNQEVHFKRESTKAGHFNMKPSFFFQTTQLLILMLGLAVAGRCLAQNPIYGIASPGFSFQVTNVPANTVFPASNPTLILTAGATYRLAIGTTPGFHPVAITTNNTALPPATAAYSSAAPQSISSGTITVTIPTNNFPTTLFYRCNVHGFTGLINILPPPPANQIVSLAVTNIVRLVSTGTTNTWVFVPEFSSNLVGGAWAPVPGYTNFFANNTNLTTFNRLEPICGPNVFLRIRQSPPN